MHTTRMVGNTCLTASDRLPLTCTRSGICCHGKEVWINPWELACLAQARGQSPAAFRAGCTLDGGIRLAFPGPPGWRGQPACSQYDQHKGCLAHPGRPLACRLYPLGRARHGEAEGPAQAVFFHEGPRFPCLDGCPGVADLPQLRVDDYLDQQGVSAGVAVQEAYLDLAADLGEVAFIVRFDTGRPVPAGPAWRQVARLDPSRWAQRLSGPWLDRLVLPDLDPQRPDFVAAHHQALQTALQQEFASLRQPQALAEASSTALTMAMLLLRSLGADPSPVASRWIQQAERR